MRSWRRFRVQAVMGLCLALSFVPFYRLRRIPDSQYVALEFQSLQHENEERWYSMELLVRNQGNYRICRSLSSLFRTPRDNANILRACNKNNNRQKFVYHNPAAHKRYLCSGTIEIPPNATLSEPIPSSTWKSKCQPQSTHNSQMVENEDIMSTLFPVIPNVDNAHAMPPIVLKFDSYSEGVRFKNCNVPCMSHGIPQTVSIRTVQPITNNIKYKTTTWFVPIFETPEQQNSQSKNKRPTRNQRKNTKRKETSQVVQPHEIQWSFTFSMEGVHYYANLQIDPHGWKRGNFYATTSFQSEIPLPYYSAAEYNLSNPSAIVDYASAEKAALFLARNCGSRNDREKIIQTLIQEADSMKPDVRIDSLGMCLHNAEPPEGIVLDGPKKPILQRYLFYLAFENQCEPDYITEKLWGALEAGTLPVYFGDANIHAHVPNHSIVSVHDFLTQNKQDDQHPYNLKSLAQHLRNIATNRSLYESYHEWRKHPLPPHFLSKYEFTQTHSTCRTCRWAYARFHGLGWNHTTQSIQELQIGSRRVCRTKMMGIVTHPFQEFWTYTNGTTVAEIKNTVETGEYETSCEEDNVNNDNENNHPALHLVNGNIQRIVYSKDGIVDILIHDAKSAAKRSVETREKQDVVDGWWDGKIQLQIRTLLHPQQASQSIIEKGHVRLQDDVSRYTLLVSPPRAATVLPMTIIKPTNNDHQQPSSQDAIVTGILTLQSFPVRVRVIVEDIDTFHQDAEKEENFFGSLMKHDFYTPLEKFVKM